MNLIDIPIPLTVPAKMRDIFCQNYNKATLNSGRMFLFAGDQKVEHLNKDFYGDGIALDDASPHHLFNIANKARIGAFATNLGLIARYAADHKNIRYIVKLNGKTDLVLPKYADPLSKCWYSVGQIVSFKASTSVDIVGIGITVYLGSEYESEMLAKAAEVIYDAHQNGLLTTVWMYPRGKSVSEEKDADIIAGAAGVAACLGADFVKVNPPEASNGLQSATLLKQATLAAGNTRIVCSGGKKVDEMQMIEDIHHQIHVGGAAGIAIGRNIHQRSLVDAIKFCEALAALVFDGADIEKAQQLLR